MRLNYLTAIAIIASSTLTAAALSPEQMGDRTCLNLKGNVKRMVFRSAGTGDNVTYNFLTNGRLKSWTDNNTGRTTKRTYKSRTQYTEPIGESCCYYTWKITCSESNNTRTDTNGNYDERRYWFYDNLMPEGLEIINWSTTLTDNSVSMGVASMYENYYYSQSDPKSLEKIYRRIKVTRDGVEDVRQVIILVSDVKKDRQGNWTSRTLTEYEIDGEYYSKWTDNRSETPIRSYCETRTITYY